MTLRPLASIALAACLPACAAPCPRYCAAAADYIEFCLEHASQPEWSEAQEAGGFTVWGYAEKAEYEAGCREDFGAQLDRDEGSVIEAECTDKASEYEQLTARGLCADLP